MSTVAKTGRARRDPDLMAAFGFRIRARRKELRLTLADVAERVGISLVAISQFERGKHGVSLSNLPKLCRALSMTPNELFGWEEAN